MFHRGEDSKVLEEESVSHLDLDELEGHINQDEKPELIEIVEEFSQTTQGIKVRINQGKRIWFWEAWLFSGIALVLSLIASGLLAMCLKNIGIIEKMMSWLQEVGATYEMQRTIANPLLIVYSMLYGGDFQVHFIFNKMDEYRFTVMLPLFFIGITIFILWLSEQIRYKLTKQTRDMYSNIAIAAINGLVVVLVATFLSKTIAIRGNEIDGFTVGSKLYMLYDQYMTYVTKPSIKVFSTVNFLRLWGMSFSLTFFTLTLCAKKRLVFREYGNVKETFIYIIRMIFIAIFILAVSIMGKTIGHSTCMPTNFTQVCLLLQECAFLLGGLICALLTGHITFLSYLIDGNNLLELKMELFTMEAYFKKSVTVLDNPMGTCYVILTLLIVGIILLGGFKHFRGKMTRFKRGFSESLIVASVLGLSVGLFSQLGAASFRLDCETTNREMSFKQLTAGVGAINFGEVALKGFIMSFVLFLLGWALSQLCPKFVDGLGSLSEKKWNYVVWIGLILTIVIIIVLTVDPKAIEEISTMFNEAMTKSKVNILLRVEELFR